MKVHPHAKINIGLQVVGKWGGKEAADTSFQNQPESGLIPEPDPAAGYHEIETILVPVSLSDTLEVNPSPAGKTTLSVSGVPIPGEVSSNLCLLAYERLKSSFPDLPAVSIRLHKRIPPGAGLGGGSSDAAHMLTVLNHMFRLGLSTRQLTQFAEDIGSDCPFFLRKSAMLATGRGHTLTGIQLTELERFNILIVVPPLHISTSWAYGRITPKRPGQSLRDLSQLPVAGWQSSIKNRFEEVLFEHYPQLQTIRDTLLDHGAVYSSLSGTGSAVYGLFPSSPPVYRIRKKFPGAGVFITSKAVC